jgi:hypothetical protein
MQQDQRFSRTVNFVVEFEAVYGSVAGFDGWCRAFLSESKARYCKNDSDDARCDELTSQRHGHFPLPADQPNGGEIAWLSIFVVHWLWLIFSRGRIPGGW